MKSTAKSKGSSTSSAKRVPLSCPNVHVRIRPLGEEGGHVANGPGVAKRLAEFDENTVTLADRHGKTKYNFSRSVKGPDSTQESVYMSVASDNVKDFIAIGGHNALIFAYGQTGTGKTFTIFGPEPSYNSAGDHELSGILPRAVKQVFDDLAGKSFVLSASAVEFYMFGCFDLLSPDHAASLIDADTGYPIGLEHFHLKTVEDVIPFMAKVRQQRTVGSTRMNVAYGGHGGSSRSHASVILTLRRKCVETNRVSISQLHVVDLAGAERPASNGYKGMSAFDALIAYYEGRYSDITASQGVVVNYELSCLRTAVVNVSSAARAGKHLVPPRQLSTAFVQYACGCFSGTYHLSMVVAMSEAPASGWETWFSCEYGKDLAELKVPVSRVKTIPMEKALELANKRVTKSLEVLARTAKPGEGPSGKYFEQRRLQKRADSIESEFMELLISM